MYKRMWFILLCIPFALLVVSLAGCMQDQMPDTNLPGTPSGPSVNATQNQTPDILPDAPGKDTEEETADTHALIEAAGHCVNWSADGWNEQLVSEAVVLEWDDTIQLTAAEGSAFSAESIEMECVPVTRIGQPFLSICQTCTATDTDVNQISIAHVPYGGVWYLPLNQPVWMGYHVSLTTNGGREDYYFVIQSEFPTLESSMYLKQMLQAALECDDLLRVLETEGDIDGVEETILSAITSECIPFLAVDGNVVYAMKRCDPSFYEYADLRAIDLDHDGQDEIILLFNNVGSFDMQCFRKEDVWQEYSLPDCAFAMTLEDHFSLRLVCPDGTLQTISADAGSAFQEAFSPYFNSSGTPYSREAEIICRFDSPSYTIDEAGIHITAVLDICAEHGLSDYHEEEYTVTGLSVPIVISMNGSGLLMEYGQVSPYN